MTDSLLKTADQEEALSCVYARAVAARAGYTTSGPEQDRDGVDLQVQAGGTMRPALDLQLKATVNLERRDDGHVHFPLKRRNYDLLREKTQTPRLLVVLDLPKDEAQWMTVTKNELVLRYRAYWLNLQGREETANKAYITVAIPKGNLFHVESLRCLMEQSRGGRIR